jgi:SNF2 family DNA or RNA helicase
LTSDSRQSTFLSALQRFVQLYQHPALLSDGAEDLSADQLVRQSSKLQVMIAKLHEIRGRREKVIIFARLRSMQGILAKVFQAEFELPVRIINGETKLRAAGSLNASGMKTRNAIRPRLPDWAEQRSVGLSAHIARPFRASCAHVR